MSEVTSNEEPVNLSAYFTRCLRENVEEPQTMCDVVGTYEDNIKLSYAQLTEWSPKERRYILREGISLEKLARRYIYIKFIEPIEDRRARQRVNVGM